MGGPSSVQITVRFGPYQCDLRSGELYKQGAKVHLADQPFRLLAVLLERPGELVTRQELQQQLWPGQSAGDFDNGLNIAINKLRTALDDKAETPQFIETVPRRGYRFVGEIETNGEKSQPASRGPEAASQESHPQATGIAPLLRRLGIALAIAGALFALWWFNPLPPPQITRIDQVTFDAFIDRPVDPLGYAGRVYYLSREGDHWNAMQTTLGSGNGQRLEGPAENHVVLDISPGGSRLLLGSFSQANPENELWTMPTSGGAPMRTGNLSASAAAFSPDGQEIAYTHEKGLWLAAADGAQARKIADLPEGASWLAWSPDGKRLRFTMGALLSNQETSIYETTRDGQNLHPVFPGWSHPPTECCGAWTPDGRYYVFTSFHGGRGNVWAMREHGSMWRRSPLGPFQLTSGPGWPFGGTPSRDGRQLYFYNAAFHQDSERVDPRTGRISPLFLGAGAMQTSFSRDGGWVVYVDSTSGSLMRSRADGLTDRIELAPVSFHASFPRWSPDGKWVAFQGSSLGQPGKVYVVAAQGGRPEPLLESKTDLHDPDWCASGKNLVVVRELEDSNPEQRELLLVDFATRHAEKIPGSQGLFFSRASPDGRYISATLHSPNQIKLWDVAARQWRTVASGANMDFSVWSPDSRYLYFQDKLGKGQPLLRCDLPSGRVETVAEFSEVLKSGVHRCALSGITAQGEPIVEFWRSAYDLFAAEVRFP